MENLRLIGVAAGPSTSMSPKPTPLFPVADSPARTPEENVKLLGSVSHVCEVKGAYALIHASPTAVVRISQEFGLPVFHSKTGAEYYAVRVAQGLTLVPSKPAPLVLTNPVPARPQSKIGTTLTLEIKDLDYRVTETDVKRKNIDSRRWEVRKLDGSLDKPYVVTFQGPDAAQCSCPDWIYRRRQCKHITGIKAAFGKVEIRHAHAG
jgi:hypothetical protein